MPPIRRILRGGIGVSETRIVKNCFASDEAACAIGQADRFLRGASRLHPAGERARVGGKSEGVNEQSVIASKWAERGRGGPS